MPGSARSRTRCSASPRSQQPGLGAYRTAAPQPAPECSRWSQQGAWQRRRPSRPVREATIRPPPLQIPQARNPSEEPMLTRLLHAGGSMGWGMWKTCGRWWGACGNPAGPDGASVPDQGAYRRANSVPTRTCTGAPAIWSAEGNIRVENEFASRRPAVAGLTRYQLATVKGMTVTPEFVEPRVLSRQDVLRCSLWTPLARVLVSMETGADPNGSGP
jgi:hypothetical protein